MASSLLNGRGPMLAQTRTKLAALVAIAAMTVVLAIAHLLAERAREGAQNRGRMARTGEVALTSLLVSLLDAETGQRGFLVARDDRYLDPYEAARVRVEGDLAAATPYVAREDRDPLHAAVETKLEELAESVRLGAEGRFDEAVARMRDDRGRRSMLEARTILQRNVERHAATRALAIEERAFYQVVARFVTFGGLAAVALLVTVVWFGIRRDLVREEEQLQLIQSQAQSLETHNASLAAANRALAVAVRERQKAIDDLERRNRDLDQFAYVTSHDLKAPLRAIGNLTTWIEEDLPATTSAETREHIALLRQRTARMELLIAGILAYSRAGRAPSAPTEPRTIEELANDAALLLGLPEGVLRVEAGGELLAPREHVELGQVLNNLVSNARKHGGAGPIHVSATHENGSLVLSVRDEGPGIDPQYHERIFEIFQTLQPRDAVEGAGIGLAIVKKLVLGAGGHVTVESALGAGATFRVTWPLESGRA